MNGQQYGNRFERWVEDLLVSREYEVERNVLKEGKSGATHELDLVFHRPHSFEKIGECKKKSIRSNNSNRKVGKGEVAVFLYVLKDLQVPSRRGHFFTTTYYTKGAKQLGESAGLKMYDFDNLVYLNGRRR